VTDDAPGTAGPGARSVLAVLREPYWVRMGLLVVLLSVACVFLGRWQWGRHEGKVAMASQIDRTYDAPPVPLAQLLPDPTAPLPGIDEWRPVRERGTYVPSGAVVVRNRPNANGEYGYEVVVPFRIDDGPVLLVDRGWIPNGASGARPDVVPPPPPREVTIVARLRPGEPPSDSVAPQGQAERIDVPRLTAPLGPAAVTHAYAVLASEDPAPANAPAVLPRPDEDLGPHLAYAIQWWLGAVVVYVLLVVYARKEAQRRAGAEPAAVSAPRPVPARRSRRSRRRELTDEEWEDLADARVQAGVRDGVVGGRTGVDDDQPGAGAQRDVDE
jgi:cytochrome oxidase assembly protein ShyY1